VKTSVITLIFSLLATMTFAGWSSSGPTGGRIATVVVAPSDPAIVWAGNAAGAFRSTDGGATWASVGGSLLDVEYLAVHPADANKAWAATGSVDAARLYRTSDGGATWIDSTDGLPAIRPSALFVDPSNPDTLYLGSHCDPNGFGFGNGITPNGTSYSKTAGVFKSTDGGATWTPSFAGLSGITQCVEELSIDPFSPWRLFITGPFIIANVGQSESYDNGRTWEHPTTPRPGLGVVFDARFPFTHYGISGRLEPSFLVSQDGGFTWSVVPTNLLEAQTPTRPTALSMDPERSRIFLGTTKGLYRSGNGGTVWAKTSLQDVDVTALDFGGTPRALFAGTSEGLVEVLNRGLGAPRPIDLHDPSANVVGLAVDPSEPNIVYASARNVGSLRNRVFRSTDGGASWDRLAGDDDVPKADVITVDGAGTVYASSTATPSLTSLYRRGRNETTWTVIPNRAGSEIVADPKKAGTVFLVKDGGVQRSRDGGATWSTVATLGFLTHIAVDPSDPRWVYAGSDFQLLRSSDGGDTWTVVDNTGTRVIVVAPSNGNVLYRLGANAGQPRPERSDDRGSTWRAIPLPDVVLSQAIAVDPRNENSVWVSAGSRLYHSADGGTTWQKEARPFLTSIAPTILRFDPSGRLHIAFPEHGVWELTGD
jgi:photosystem II stability/assembly factor-like uncharacterized protein